MNVWFLTNVVLSALALVFVRATPDSPHRLRFLVCFIALCCWLVPWGAMSGLVPSTIFSGFTGSSGAAGISGIADLGTALARDALAPDALPRDSGYLSAMGAILDGLFAVATAVGAWLILLSSIRYARFTKRIAEGSTNGAQLWARVGLPEPVGSAFQKPPRLRIQREVPGALTTGLFAPIIWIHEDLLEHPCLEGVLAHECRHVRNCDNLYLWVITFVEKLLWWNPIAGYLGSQSRRLQELACDEACAARDAGYRQMLNRLVLSLSEPEPSGNLCPQISHMSRDTNFNVHRVRALKKRYVMKTRHYAATAILFSCASLTLAFAFAQGTSPAVVDAPADAGAPQAQPAVTSPPASAVSTPVGAGPAPVDVQTPATASGHVPAPATAQAPTPASAQVPAPASARAPAPASAPAAAPASTQAPRPTFAQVPTPTLAQATTPAPADEPARPAAEAPTQGTGPARTIPATEPVKLPAPVGVDELTSLEIYATELEGAYDRLKAENDALRSEIDRLSNEIRKLESIGSADAHD